MNAGKFMTFKLADEEYGFEILKVREIIGLCPITRVPRAKEFVRGVINLRGRVIPVIDLRQKFGLSQSPVTEQSVIIVVQLKSASNAVTLGVVVDEVLEVLEIKSDQIEPPPRCGEVMFDEEVISGVAKSAERVVFLLDADKVLSGVDVEHTQAA